ncbi:acyl-homoserine-lactone synthase [Enterovibrio norvegicus]|uniref:acyl-homoserine-lactone synthase n=1 Tax=Enterovibrio norvegicus TaxID=188144 RepID=UPI000C83214E|nr:acyl-homoserine-lactone synthase [Enterovibrio norvegicus]PML77791.1 autoinducer synthesis protein [Enterovibrio norvegicus]
MSQLITLTPESKFNNPAVLNNIFRLRHRSFLERLGWEVDSTQDMESDNFDEMDQTSYVALTEENQEVIGCWRAMPTQGEYMLKDVFPQLLQGEEAPMEEGIWEISRFTTSKESYENTNGWFGNNALTLIRSFYDFAQENRIRAYVLVTTVGCERMLRSLGLNMRRMGDGKSLKVGKERSVALRLEVDENLKIHIN